MMVSFYPSTMQTKADELQRLDGKFVMLPTLGLALTTLTFLEVYYGDKEAVGVLRDSYILWAIFYTEATRKVCSFLTSPDI
jgi:hypothetical protein